MKQNTPEWLEFRRKNIGASDAPIIMGVSPWKTRYELWLEKLSLVPSSAQNIYMQRGIEMEPKARAEFERLTNIPVTPKVLSHRDIPYMIASLDGISSCGRYIVEIKCAGPKDHELAKKGIIPDKYYPQLQHQLEVCDLDMGYYFSFDSENGVILEVQRDKEYVKKLLEAEKEFYTNMTQFVAPSLMDSDFFVREDEKMAEAVIEWQTAKKKLSEIEKLERSCHARLLELAEGRSTTGYGVKITRYLRKGNVDYSAIPELKDVDLEIYRKEPIVCWKIS